MSTVPLSFRTGQVAQAASAVLVVRAASVVAVA
jgi:hypothetical protein